MRRARTRSFRQAMTLLLYCCFTAASLLLHCCFTAAFTHTYTHTHTHINILCFTGVVDVDAQDIQIEPDKKAQGGLGVLYKGIWG
jgi:hypothetical protein